MSQLQPGQSVFDPNTGESRFRIDHLLNESLRHRIYLAFDTHLDDKEVCLKICTHERPFDSLRVQERRAGLLAELQTLTLPSPLIPEPLDWLAIGNSSGPEGLEPALVYELQHGKSLASKIAANGPMPIPHAIRLVHETALFLSTLHEAGYCFRNLNPEHIIVGLDEAIHFVGFGNCAPLKATPRFPLKDNPFVAPEARGLGPLSASCDAFSLGALWLSCLTALPPELDGTLSTQSLHKLQSLAPSAAKLAAQLLHPQAAQRLLPADLAMLLEHGQLPASDHPLISSAQPTQCATPQVQQAPQVERSAPQPPPKASEQEQDKTPVKTKEQPPTKFTALNIVAAVLALTALLAIVAVLLLALL